MDKKKMPLPLAKRIAELLVERLRPYCERIEIAGSIRRQKAEVGDIELVAIPKSVLDIFGEPLPLQVEHALDRVDWSEFGTFIKGKHKYKQIALREGCSLDLFIVVPPAQFGTIFLIRTGPEEYSHKLVTQRKYGGWMPSNLKESSGAIWHGMTLIPTPEERDVYKLLDLPWIPPQERRVTDEIEEITSDRSIDA